MRGPREGFIEDVKTNLSLIERRLKSPALAVEKTTIGRISQTAVAMVYLSNVADPEVVNAVREKLKKIDIDALTDSHYIQPYLEERPFSIFHQTGVTEKPDIVTAKLLEGRVAIVVDGSPMVVTVPFMAVEDYQSSEDYYERPSLATFLRILRFFSIFFAVLLPGLYVAPNQEGTLTLLRVAFTALGGLGGMYFMLVGVLYLVLYLCSLGGFGTPYLAPFAPLIPGDLKDSFYRASLLRMNERPRSIKNVNPHRQKEEK